MLALQQKRSYQTSDGLTWDVYQDDTDSSIFYIVPLPLLMLLPDAQGKLIPAFKLVEYQTGDAYQGNGYCYLSTRLGIPPEDELQLHQQIAAAFPAVTPRYNTLPYQSGGRATVTYATSDGLSTGAVSTIASDYGDNVASFLIPLDSQGMALFKAIFGDGSGSGGVMITYAVSVGARLPAITAEIKFDATVAYEYEVEHTRVLN